MKTIIVANWKCNPTTLQEAKRLFSSVKRGLRNIKNKSTEVVVCPPFVYLSILGGSSLAHRKTSFGGLALGSQDCFWEERGAFTGEISFLMLKDLGCQYVILGHSERRRYFKETDEMINRKMRAVLSVKLKPILCIGEAENERKKRLTQKILKSQIEKGLREITEKDINQVIIAYEPIWAIGTGKACLPEGAEKVAIFIRKIISKIYSQKITKRIPILYGGSINSQNALSYTAKSNLQGFLVGGASLDPQEFVKIIKNVRRA